MRLNIAMGTMIIVLMGGQLAAEMSLGRAESFQQLYHGGLLLGYLPRLYNGERGGGAWTKWLFMGFIPYT